MQEKLVKDELEEKESVANLTQGRNLKAESEVKEFLIPTPRFKMVSDKVLRVTERPNMTHPQKVMAILRAFYMDLDDGREHVAMITLDHDLKFLNLWDVTEKSGSDHASIDKKEMIRRLVGSDYAAAFIIAHNHPSGKAEMSEDDWASLQDLKNDAVYLQTPLRDFIILDIRSDKYYSRRDECYEL